MCCVYMLCNRCAILQALAFIDPRINEVYYYYYYNYHYYIFFNLYHKNFFKYIYSTYLISKNI